MRRLALVLVLAGSAVLALGSAGGPETSERYAYSTYRETSGRLTLLVDGFLAGLHGEDRYIPVAVVVGLEGPGPSVSVTPESFALLDESGKEYAAVPYEELARQYPKRQFDESASRSHPIVVGDQFSMSIRLGGDFYPAPAGRGTRVDRVELAPYTWFHTLLYFPRPQGGLDGVLTLGIRGAGTERPIQVRFRIPRIELGSPPPAG